MYPQPYTPWPYYVPHPYPVSLGPSTYLQSQNSPLSSSQASPALSSNKEVPPPKSQAPPLPHPYPQYPYPFHPYHHVPNFSHHPQSGALQPYPPYVYPFVAPSPYFSSPHNPNTQPANAPTFQQSFVSYDPNVRDPSLLLFCG